MSHVPASANWPKEAFDNCTRSGAMTDRVIELAGIDAIQTMYDEATP